MDWTAQIDGYCERLAPGFWAEPLNAVTNAAFLVAALWAGLHARRRGELSPAIVVLCALLAAIGVGSFLFHTFATRWAALADVLPIQLFSLVALVTGLHRFSTRQASKTAVMAAAALVVLFAVTWALAQGVPPGLRGAVGYAPAWLSLWGFALYTLARRHSLRGPMGAAAVTFTLSLTLRTLDAPLCAEVPFGTHFLWHIFNAVTLALVIRVLVGLGRRKPE